ncbi:MAG: septum formation initiator family protein [Bacteroidota bacterium]|nr:septum formation initiator family protein [Bacteroidota bacterium]MDP4230668.1 septum formation initiator family protein [Bacteroidota bacterium]MDP4235358.1 septum formation initiator family protein [Bacteroidota bacterium]
MPRLALKKRIRKILKTPKLLLITATILILSTTLLFANKGIWRHVSLRRDVSSLHAEDAALDIEEQKLKDRVALLDKEDPTTIERIARERFHLKKRDEIIYRREKSDVGSRDAGFGK